jgi:low temperature requirement protein LtrA
MAAAICTILRTQSEQEVSLSVPSLNQPLRRMTGRDPHEPHRASTPLELLFDLSFVVAFGIAGSELAHLLAEGHVTAGLGAFSFAMVAIVWAWINFSWFASAFDTDDWAYRITTMVQIAGVLVLALGLADVFESVAAGHHVNNRVMVAGYVVMRVAMIAQWLRAAAQAPQYRRVAMTYALFVGVAQLGWVALAIADLPFGWTLAGTAVAYLIEFSGPFFAETRRGRTPWHTHHIAERYSLMTIIALGEGVLGTVTAVQPVIAQQGWSGNAVILVAAGTLLTFGLWWVYFSIPFAELLERRGSGQFVFGYGHIPLFASIAAVGAGLHVGAYVVAGEAHVGYAAAVESVAVPVAVFMVTLFTLYSVLVRRTDVLHLLLFAGVLVALVASVLLAQAGLAFAVCVMIIAIAPVVVIVGFETVGHRHLREHLERLESSAD